MNKNDSALLDGVLGNLFGSKHVLFVPPEVRVTGMPPYITYPVCPLWKDEMLPLPPHKDVNLFPLVGRDDIDALEHVGWKWKTDVKGLLNDFLRLAAFAPPDNPEAQGDSVSQEGVEKVQAFAQKWGPLWRCRTHSRDPFCFCSWTLPSTGHRLIDPACEWSPIEAVQDFLDCAADARTVLEVADLLNTDREVPKPLLVRLCMSPDGVTPQKIRKGLVTFVNVHIVYLGGPTISLTWDETRNPTCNIRTGLGFIHVVWWEIAQGLGLGAGFAQCSGCGTFYFRTGRKPKAGQGNYCPECREGDRGSKKLHARKRRAKG